MTCRYKWRSPLSIARAFTGARALAHQSCGSSLIEFALSIGLLMTVVVGIMGFSLEVFAEHFVANAARAAARYAMVRGSTAATACASVSASNCTATSSNVVNYVQSITPGGISLASLAVTSSWPGTTPAGSACANISGNNSPGCMVTITVKYAFSFYLPFVGQDTATISSTGAQTITQ